MQHCDSHDPTFVCPGKNEWPELVGKTALEAKAVILRENPLVDRVVIDVFPNIAPPDYCCNRVYVLVDAQPNGRVLFAPRTD